MICEVQDHDHDATQEKSWDVKLKTRDDEQHCQQD